VFVQPVEGAVLDLDAPPDRRLDVEQSDLELVEPLGGGDGTDTTGAFEGASSGTISATTLRWAWVSLTGKRWSV
jgi:hypothetical protein